MKNVTSIQIINFIFLFFVARNVDGVHGNVCNLNSLLLKLKYAFRKISMIGDTKVQTHILSVLLLYYPSNNTKKFENCLRTNRKYSMISLQAEFTV